MALLITPYRLSAQYLKFGIEANKILPGGLLYEISKIYVDPVSRSSLDITGNP